MLIKKSIQSKGWAATMPVYLISHIEHIAMAIEFHWFNFLCNYLFAINDEAAEPNEIKFMLLS